MVNMSQNVFYLTNKSKFDTSLIEADIVAVFTTRPGSALHASQKTHLQNRISDLKRHKVAIYFVTSKEEFIDDECFLCDSEREIIDLCHLHKSKKNIDDSLIIFSNENGSLKPLTCRLKPETRNNWVQVVMQFATNYHDKQPFQGNMWKYGQIVQESGEYMCTDCGYIISLNRGDVFPSCEVCLSGDPEGPVGPEVGFWEKI